MSKLNLNSKQEIIGSAKSAFSINFPFYIFALGILLAFSAFQCEDNEDWCGTGKQQSCDKSGCEVLHIATVTVEEVICGAGLWENNWLNDGSKVYLQPYSMDENVKAKIEKLNIDIKNGLHLKIQYTHAKDEGRYDNAIICEAYVGEKTPIQIVDIEVVNN